jgi:hypothetical protein
MALIRGVTSLYPCPRCLIHTGDQGDLLKTEPLRTVKTMKAILLKARSEETLGEKESVLKEVGLRDIKVYPRSVIKVLYYY